MINPQAAELGAVMCKTMMKSLWLATALLLVFAPGCTNQRVAAPKLSTALRDMMSNINTIKYTFMLLKQSLAYQFIMPYHSPVKRKSG